MYFDSHEVNLKENPQLCYFALDNSKGVAMNLLIFGYKQFIDTYLYKSQIKLKQLCENISSTPPDVNNIADFALNNLIDSIKIHICFENFIKALLLANGIIVHHLDKNIFPAKHKKQKKEPVFRDEIISISKWVENEKIKLPLPNLRLQIPGILNNTIGTSILLQPGYLNKINITQETIDLIKPYLDYRNNLHYYTEESFSLSKNTWINFNKIIDFINKNLIRIQHILVEELKHGDSYKLKEI